MPVMGVSGSRWGPLSPGEAQPKQPPHPLSLAWPHPPGAQTHGCWPLQDVASGVGREGPVPPLPSEASASCYTHVCLVTLPGACEATEVTKVPSSGLGAGGTAPRLPLAELELGRAGRRAGQDHQTQVTSSLPSGERAVGLWLWPCRAGGLPGTCVQGSLGSFAAHPEVWLSTGTNHLESPARAHQAKGVARAARRAPACVCEWAGQPWSAAEACWPRRDASSECSRTCWGAGGLGLGRLRPTLTGALGRRGRSTSLSPILGSPRATAVLGLASPAHPSRASPRSPTCSQASRPGHALSGASSSIRPTLTMTLTLPGRLV